MTKIKSRVKISLKNLSVFSFLMMGALTFSACQSSQNNSTNTPAPTPTVEEKKGDDFQNSLKSVQTGNFDFVYAFRRPDGEVLTSDDKKFLKDNSPLDTNQWALTADGKAAIAGSNYKFMPEHLAALKKRFNVEDYSPKPDNSNSIQNPGANQNVNAGK